MREDSIIIEQSIETNFVDVYVRKDKELVEIEQGIPLAKMFTLVNKFANDYGITQAVFKEYDESGNKVAERDISLEVKDKAERNKKMRETIIKNKEFSDLFIKLLETSIKLLKLPIGPDAKYESEQEKHEVFNQLYAYYHDSKTNQNLLNKLQINEANDLIVFYEELLKINQINK